MNLLLDTNILVDYVGARPPFFENAQKVVAAGYFGDAKLWASAQSVKDAYYILSHYVDQGKVQRCLHRTLDVISLVSLSATDASRGLFLEWDDYEDCLIALCAVAAKADFLITRDKRGFARSPIPTLFPEAWIAFMKSEHNTEYESIDWPRT